MTQNLLKYGTPMLLFICMAIYFYQEGKRSAEFEQKIKRIDEIRQSLLDSVGKLQQQTNERDEKLRKIIGKNMDILDTLNSCLDKVNKSARMIDNQIKNNQRKIDELWKTN